MLPEIGKIIRQRRQQQGITIEQLAEQSNVSISLISRLERGKVNNIKIQSLSAIAETLNLKLADFFRDPLLQSTNVVALLDYLSDLPVNQREELAGVLLKLLHLAKWSLFVQHFTRLINLLIIITIKKIHLPTIRRWIFFYAASFILLIPRSIQWLKTLIDASFSPTTHSWRLTTHRLPSLWVVPASTGSPWVLRPSHHLDRLRPGLILRPKRLWLVN